MQLCGGAEKERRRVKSTSFLAKVLCFSRSVGEGCQKKPSHFVVREKEAQPREREKKRRGEDVVACARVTSSSDDRMFSLARRVRVSACVRSSAVAVVWACEVESPAFISRIIKLLFPSFFESC